MTTSTENKQTQTNMNSEIREMMRRQRLDMKELAHLLSTDVSTILRWVRGARSPKGLRADLLEIIGAAEPVVGEHLRTLGRYKALGLALLERAERE